MRGRRRGGDSWHKIVITLTSKVGKKGQTIIDYPQEKPWVIFTFSLLCYSIVGQAASQRGCSGREYFQTLAFLRAFVPGGRRLDESWRVRKIEFRVCESFPVFCGFKTTCENIASNFGGRNTEHGKDMSLYVARHFLKWTIRWKPLTNHRVPTCLSQTYFPTSIDSGRVDMKNSWPQSNLWGKQTLLPCFPLMR